MLPIFLITSLGLTSVGQVLSVGDRVRLLASSLPGLDRLLLDQEDWDMVNIHNTLLNGTTILHFGTFRQNSYILLPPPREMT